MTAFYIIYTFICGLCLGSFFNVIGLRLPQGESIIRPRSHCPQCKHTLRAVELIPVISYLLLRGKCRRCGVIISPLYPLLEVATATLFTLALVLLGWSGEVLIAWALISLLIIVVVSDIRYMLIPDKVLLFFAALLLLLRAFIPLEPWWDSFAGAALGFVLLLGIAVVSRGGLGGGDIKLFAVLGLALGWKGLLLSFFFAALYGTLLGGIGLLSGKVQRGKPIPFAPAICLGTLTVYFFGTALLEWYVKFFRSIMEG